MRKRPSLFNSPPMIYSSRASLSLSLFRPSSLSHDRKAAAANIGSELLTQSVACLRASLAFSEREEPAVQGFNGGELEAAEAAASALRACHSQFRRSTGTTKTSTARRRAEDMGEIGSRQREGRQRMKEKSILVRRRRPRVAGESEFFSSFFFLGRSEN